MPEAAGSLSVVVADDSLSYRAGLVRAIDREPRLRLVESVADGDAALAAIRDHEPDLALLDVNMPGRSGLEVCSELAPSCPTRVVLISAAMDPQLAGAARSAGAVDGIGKDLARRHILDVLLGAVAARR